MANIIPLKDDTGAQFYPQTHLKAVIDSEGNTLDEILENLEPGGATNAVKYTPQTLTTAQKTQARTNIDAPSSADVSGKQDTLVSGTNIKTVNGESLLGSGNIVAGDPNAVKYTSQTLTDAQKAQARTNIGAGTYSKPSGGIPSSDLASGVIPSEIDTVNVTVDNNTGTPSATASVSGSTLSLAFQNLKGAQGNTGSSVDYPYELVNNRTTDDSTKALSAAEGKRLGEDIDLRATKEETILLQGSSSPDNDLEIGDDNENIILAISNGVIKTKAFDSSKLHTVPDNSILCIGDSLTMGTGTGKIYPNYLQALVGSDYVVENLGEGGDKIQDIMARTNAFPAVTAGAFTIPASGSVSIGGLISSYDYARNINLLKQSQEVFNPVEIMGVKGYLTASGNYESVTYTFARLIAGDAVSVPKWTPVYGNEGLNLGNSKVMVLWGGQNGLFSDEDELVAMDKAVVEAMGIRDYCVIGPTNNNYQYDAYTRCVFDYDTLTAKMRKQFGCHYIDMLGYFLTDALSDAGITPTAADEAAIANDKVPPSLLADTVHYNATGFELVANKIYQVLKQLNYV